MSAVAPIRANRELSLPSAVYTWLMERRPGYEFEREFASTRQAKFDIKA